MYPLSQLIKIPNEFPHLAAVKALSGCLGNDALWVLIFGTPRCPMHPGAEQPAQQLLICTPLSSLEMMPHHSHTSLPFVHG